MPTVAVPISTRDQVEATIARHVGGEFSPAMRLETLGDTGAVLLLLELELQFGVLLDVDEVLPDGSMGGLVALVALRARDQMAAAPPSNLIDLAAARAARARRAQAEFEIPPPPRATVALPPEPVDFPRLSTRRALIRLGLTALLSGAAAGVAFHCLAP